MKAHKNYKLPNQPQQRQKLTFQIKDHIRFLQTEIAENQHPDKIQQQQNNIQLLSLRLKLINRCKQMSLVRLNHLQQIFRHYCTHVFRIGKHMTFDRLEYDRVHMTIQRFFLFLKDFNLTSALIQGSNRQVIEKTQIITIFKKKASNARQLSFQQFIQCLQKLALIYWDQKGQWGAKQQEILKKKQQLKIMLDKRKKKRQARNRENYEQPQAEEAEQEQAAQQKQKSQQKQKQKELEHINQNDGLVDELMANEDIEDPNEEVNKVAAAAQRQNIIARQAKKAALSKQATLLSLSVQEKIQYYYGLLDIDTIASYRKKMTDLNIYKVAPASSTSTNIEQKSLSESKIMAIANQQQERLKKLKAKMMQKKEKIKQRPLPKPSNEQAQKEKQKAEQRKEANRDRKEVQKIKQQDAKVKEKKVVQYRQNQVTWQTINQLNLEQLRLKQFNPAKIVGTAEDDRYFLQEYGAGPKLTERLYARQRQSLSIVQSTKMRAAELEKKQRGQSSKKQISKAISQIRQV